MIGLLRSIKKRFPNSGYFAKYTSLMAMWLSFYCFIIKMSGNRRHVRLDSEKGPICM